MVDITKSVGDQGNNASEDVALVQLMLRVVKNAKGQYYFNGNYNGTYDQKLKSAILAFQQDQKLVAEKPSTIPGSKQPAKAPPPAGLAEKPGLVGPNSKTLTALVGQLPASHKDIRIIPLTKTIYVAGDAGKAALSASAIRAEKELNADFREKVAKLVESMYKNHKLVLAIPQSGWRRDFAAQAKVIKENPNATGAGPGESPHQFGRAVDIGFSSIKWVAGDGSVKNDNYWLAAQGMQYAKQQELWAARDAIAFKQLGLFKTNKSGDFIHVQGFADEKVSWGKSLAKLLETASPAKAKWSYAGQVANKNTYKVDLGLGIAVNVGSSLQMWNGEAPINKADLAKALNVKLAVDPNFSIEKFFGAAAKPNPIAAPNINAKAAPDQKAAPAKAAQLKEADIKASYIQYLQKLVKTEIQAADQNWDSWTPVK
jgi:peptidoglycan hydrolase-like protein with peptidoglycan-binding domain